MIPSHETLSKRASGERGGSRLNFLISIAIVGMLAYAVYQYAPVAYQGYMLKDFMQDRVNYAVATGKSAEWTATQLRASADEYGIPPDATVNAQQRDGRIEATIRFARPVVLPGYVYEYNFDHTAKSSTFLTAK